MAVTVAVAWTATYTISYTALPCVYILVDKTTSPTGRAVVDGAGVVVGVLVVVEMKVLVEVRVLVEMRVLVVGEDRGGLGM